MTTMLLKIHNVTVTALGGVQKKKKKKKKR